MGIRDLHLSNVCTCGVPSEMAQIAEFSTDGIYVVDGRGITLYVNSAYEKMTGYNRTELIGQHMRDLMNRGYFDQSVSLLVLEQKREISIVQRIGKDKEVVVTGNPVRDSHGEILMVVTSVRDVTELNRMARELKKYQYSTNDDLEMIFESNEMQRIYEQAMTIAPFPTSVILTGASGVGKEVLANFIHNQSDRKEQAFIKINCGAIPESLLETELFGYENGAFTNARKEGKVGLIELANKGTLLLDEISEMSMPVQVSLLRVLQEKKVRRVGGTKSIPIDVRIIAASNKDLHKMVKQGQFREDLFYRIAVIEIAIPSLKDRKKDIRPLIDHYLTYYCKRFRLDKQLTEECYDYLERYAWPGNIRELRNVVENIVVATSSHCITPEHLPLPIRNQSETDVVAKSNLSDGLKSEVERYERIVIQKALEKHGSIRQAAHHLKIDHSTLIKKMKKLCIEKPS
ncbi:sigma-54 interaction domain-containing protein [Sulfoacidibacillus thermotolerans]|uniref:HTH-type transcriptional regulatory protein TyrR n=1 Tax=Sulfoacidibacillus thermotolerans TaxID=1765684 RepID=A0A2U3D617_SULT2|nr:sigma 54-interacting transcriptional regulator [Sulfoacidibacillus thermotolerans]PWI56714.1 Fis family transcriptional regulator [Sulfoacidibacillus thermotolerans]